jgi:hypothetical protein
MLRLVPLVVLLVVGYAAVTSPALVGAVLVWTVVGFVGILVVSLVVGGGS